MTPDNKRITSRFKSWDEIFPDPAEADHQYLGLLAELRDRYLGNETLLKERVEVNPQTGLAAAVFEKTSGGYHRIERLPSGDIRYESSFLGEIHITEVVPQAGNKQHGWTLDEIVGLQAQTAAAWAKSRDPKERESLAFMLSRLRGKPATMEWEGIMLEDDKLPQRMGYKIYPDDVLSAAKKRLK